MWQKLVLLRYPGGKQRQVHSFAELLPLSTSFSGRYFEPFLGAGAVFFFLEPRQAILSDINPELIELYEGIRDAPLEVWQLFRAFPSDERTYYEIRAWQPNELSSPMRAARLLYLNRTCFRGMWRYNAKGQFNIAYGWEDRRKTIDQESLLEVSRRLQNCILKCADYETMIEMAQQGDFIFLDPPYQPNQESVQHAHYFFGSFDFGEQHRLAKALERASSRGVIWAMTNSSNARILNLYTRHYVSPLLRGIGDQIGTISDTPGEVIIRNYEE